MQHGPVYQWKTPDLIARCSGIRGSSRASRDRPSPSRLHPISWILAAHSSSSRARAMEPLIRLQWLVHWPTHRHTPACPTGGAASLRRFDIPVSHMVVYSNPGSAPTGGRASTELVETRFVPTMYRALASSGGSKTSPVSSTQDLHVRRTTTDVFRQRWCRFGVGTREAHPKTYIAGPADLGVR